MTVQILLLNVPESLYEQLERRARERDRSVEEETLDLLAAAVPAADALPDAVESALLDLQLLDDQSLIKASRTHLPEQSAADLEELHLKMQRGAITASERQTLQKLVADYERVMLIRGRASALARERGLQAAAPDPNS